MSTASTAETGAQLLSISTAFLLTGASLAFSFFDIPNLIDSPAQRSLPQIRWLFSRGSHIFPQFAIASASAFVYLAVKSVPSSSSWTSFLNLTLNSTKVNGYLAAAALTMGIAPYTMFVMLPTNMQLIKMNEKGSEKAAKEDGDAKVDALLNKFGWLNISRASLTGAGGLVGLWTALAA